MSTLTSTSTTTLPATPDPPPLFLPNPPPPSSSVLGKRPSSTRPTPFSYSTPLARARTVRPHARCVSYALSSGASDAETGTGSEWAGPDEEEDEEGEEEEEEDEGQEEEEVKGKGKGKATPKQKPMIVNGQLVAAPAGSSSAGRPKRYRCTFDSCSKSYTKPTRLAEHERSHTGERPYACPHCPQSYRRETHLTAHMRSHLPASDRPFACDFEGCEKRFWTAQHLERHRDVHRGAKAFECTEDNCTEAFAKHYQLRRHVAEAHCPAGTKPFRCTDAGCTSSFTTSQRLRNHLKTHDEGRYACAAPECSALNLTFPTWTALQSHARTAHPPTCPHPECAGRTFASRKGLRGHLKLHEEREHEGEMREAVREGVGSEEEEGEGEGEGKRRRVEQDVVGRDWKCDEEGCGKAFKSKKALKTHYQTAHLRLRPFACEHPGCDKAYGHKHLLQRHVARAHAAPSSSSTQAPPLPPSLTSSTISPSTANTAAPAPAAPSIADFTGLTYARAPARTLPCPYAEMLGGDGAGGVTCEFRFSRVYDLRRHLASRHGFEVDVRDLKSWLEGKKEEGVGEGGEV